MRSLWFALSLLLLTSAAHSEETVPMIDRVTDPEIRDAINNAHHEMVICLAFWTISVEGLRRKDPNSPEAADIDKHSASLLGTILYLHSPEVTAARYKMAIADQMNRMKRDYVNFSLLIADHFETCKAIGESPVGYVEKRILQAGGN